VQLLEYGYGTFAPLVPKLRFGNVLAFQNGSFGTRRFKQYSLQAPGISTLANFADYA
jgi:hypothetical protein